MKLVAFLAILAFAVAVPVQKSVVISTPEKLVVIAVSKEYKKNDFPEQRNDELNRFEPYEQQYFPHEDAFQVAQYITYQLHQAQQNNYQASEVASQLTKQGFPQFVVEYFVEQYEPLKAPLVDKLPYQTFQYYYEQDVPKEVQEYVAHQIAQAYQHYQQYHLSKGQQTFEQEYPSVFPDVAQYVIQQAKYYAKPGLSYPAIQYTIQQLQKVQQHAQNALEVLENDLEVQENVRKEAYQYVIQLLQKGQQYIQTANKIYEKYQTYHQFYVSYYDAEYFFHQVLEAHQFFQSAYQYIQQQPTQGFQFPQYIFEQVQYAYFGTQDIYHSYQQIQIGQFKHRNEFSFAYGEYVTKQLLLAQQYAQNAQELIQKQVAQNTVPQTLITNILEQLKLGQNYVQNALQAVQQVTKFQTYQYVAQETQQALFYFQQAYQAIQQQSFDVDVTKHIEYALQYSQNAFFAAQQATHQDLYPSPASYKPAYSLGYNLTYYQAVQQIRQYVLNAQQYIQSQVTLPQVSLIAQQLDKFFEVYQPVQQLFQQGYTSQPIVQYAKHQLYPAYQYLFTAYQSAQQEGLYYVAQQLQYALKLVQYLQYANLNQTTQDKPSFLRSFDQYGFNYGYENLNQQPFEYSKYAKQYLQKLAAQGVIPEQYVTYIFQQLQHTPQDQQYYQNVYQYIQGQITSGAIPQYAGEYLANLLRNTQQVTQKTYQPFQQNQYYGQKYPTNKQSFDQLFLKNYFNKNEQYLGKSDYQGQNQAIDNAFYKPYNTNQQELTQHGVNKYYLVIQKIQQYIQNAQQYVQSQGSFPQASLIAQQLAKSFEAYKSAEYFFQQGSHSQPIDKQQLLEANQYVYTAYHIAQQEGLYYIAQQLKDALTLAQYLQYTGIDQTTESKPSFLKDDDDTYGFNYRYEQSNEYTVKVQQYVYQLVAQNIIPKQYGTYIIQQLQQAQQNQQYYQNLYQFIQQHVANGNIPQYAGEHLSELVRTVQQASQKIYQPFQEQYYGEKYTTNQNYGYYGPYSTVNYQNEPRPYGLNQYEFYGLQEDNRSYKPYQYETVSQGYYPYSFSNSGRSQIAAAAA